jgi:hypothetical protein
MNTLTRSAEPARRIGPVTEFNGAFIIHFMDKVSMTHEEGGFDIEDGVVYVSQGRYWTTPGYLHFRINGIECEIEDDQIEYIEIVN